MQTMDNIDTDNVATADTENTSADSQDIEQPQAEPEAVEQTEEEKAEQAKQEQETEKQSRSQKRIQQLAREKAELQRKVAEYEQKQSEPKASDAPNIEDFDDYSEYQKAQQEYYVAQAEQRVLAKLEAEKAQQSQVEQQAEFETAISELKDGGVDVDGLMAKADTLPPLPITLDQFGLSAKDTLSLAAELLQNDDLYIELSQLNPVQAAVKIGQMIASKQPSNSAPTKVPTAPPPIKPVTANAPVAKDPSKMSDDEWYRQESQKRKGK